MRFPVGQNRAEFSDTGQHGTIDNWYYEQPLHSKIHSHLYNNNLKILFGNILTMPYFFRMKFDAVAVDHHIRKL
jgi:hypothetical protein